MAEIYREDGINTLILQPSLCNPDKCAAYRARLCGGPSRNGTAHLDNGLSGAEAEMVKGSPCFNEN